MTTQFPQVQPTSVAAAGRHPVDEVPPIPQLALLGFQHVLVMYAGAVAVPLIIGGALHLPKDVIAFLITADLFCCGLMSIVQSMGVGKFGIRLPMMMGVTFTAVPAIIAAGGDPNVGLPGVFGAVMAAGLFTMLTAPLIGRMIHWFPPVVTGTVVLVIGVSMMRVGVNWAAGGNPTIPSANGPIPNPAYGVPLHIGIGALVMLLVLVIHAVFRSFIANISVLIALVVGFLIAMFLGQVSFEGVATANWLTLVTPLHFGWPKFELIGVATLCVVMVVIMIEGVGQFLAIGDIVGKPVTPDDIVRGLRVDGLGGLVGGFFNTFTYTSFAQNVGLVQITGIRSRWVCVAAGVILIALSALPKLSFLVASMPVYVLGGAALVMFGMMASAGIRILNEVDFKGNENNLYVVGISLAVGLIPLVAPSFFSKMPDLAARFFSNGILTGTFTAVLLNVLLNRGTREGSPSKGLVI